MGEKIRKSFQIVRNVNLLKNIEIAAEARFSYQNEKVRVVPSNEMVAYVDMQKVIILARLSDLKQTIFCKRLVLFNETFESIRKSEVKPVGVLWHEALKGQIR